MRGRALGEVTKYLVYNLRNRGRDSADRYFASTEIIARLKDMRRLTLARYRRQPSHGRGSVGADGKKRGRVDNMVSMSDMKYDTVVGCGIDAGRGYKLPGESTISSRLTSALKLTPRLPVDISLLGKTGRRKGAHARDVTEDGWEDVEH
ncbi:hypothetical protein D9758_013929 [Tetrapyrgos nigripes]|uniref:Uncharacterized protein n=1 Tax=Tetrapyrgos nigripes TaxID=182062 RepID=A0A8H5FLX8_9AGAR|nr:hypothetical protein D9758_013929 [Tetrapyrgos nigripes]